MLTLWSVDEKVGQIAGSAGDRLDGQMNEGNSVKNIFGS